MSTFDSVRVLKQSLAHESNMLGFQKAFSKAVEILRGIPGSTDVMCVELARAYPVAEQCFLQLSERHGRGADVRQYAAWNAILSTSHVVFSQGAMWSGGSTSSLLAGADQTIVVGCSDTRIHSGIFGIESENFYRLPGGRSAKSFFRDSSGQLVFCLESPLGAWIAGRVEAGASHMFFLGHTGCAACRIETREHPEDARHDEGALHGFCQQVEMARATESFFRVQGRDVAVLSVLYDVVSGEVFLGLEAHLGDADLVAQGFTEKVLQRLRNDETVLSTSLLLQMDWLRAVVERLMAHYRQVSFPSESDVRACLRELLEDERIRHETKGVIGKLLPTFSGKTEIVGAIRHILLANVAGAICRTTENSGHALRNKASLMRVGTGHGFPLAARALALSEFDSQSIGLLADVVREGRMNGSLSEFDRQLAEVVFPLGIENGGTLAHCPVGLILGNRWGGTNWLPLSLPRRSIWPTQLEDAGKGGNFSLTPI